MNLALDNLLLFGFGLGLSVFRMYIPDSINNLLSLVQVKGSDGSEV